MNNENENIVYSFFSKIEVSAIFTVAFVLANTVYFHTSIWIFILLRNSL